MPTESSSVLPFEVSPYEPPEAIGADLDRALNGQLTVTDRTEQSMELAEGIEAVQFDYTGVYSIGEKEWTYDGFETISPFSAQLSVSSDLGLGAIAILAQATMYGQPDLIYFDEGEVIPDAPIKTIRQPETEEYRDLTAEWYSQEAAETGIKEARLSNRAVDLEASEIPIDELEQWAATWFGLRSPSK